MHEALMLLPPIDQMKISSSCVSEKLCLIISDSLGVVGKMLLSAETSDARMMTLHRLQ